MKKAIVILLVVVIALMAAVPAFASPPDPFPGQGPKSTGPGDCNYGVVHAFLARSGLTGQVHIPGTHMGAAGFCVAD